MRETQKAMNKSSVTKHSCSIGSLRFHSHTFKLYKTSHKDHYTLIASLKFLNNQFSENHLQILDKLPFATL